MNKVSLFLVVCGCLAVLASCDLFTSSYTVAYDANSSSAAGSAPSDSATYHPGDQVTAKSAGDLSRSGYTFAGWNTKADGIGTTYASGATFAMGLANVTLYGMWNSSTATLASVWVTDADDAVYNTTATFNPGTTTYEIIITYPAPSPATLHWTSTDPNAKVISVTEWNGETSYEGVSDTVSGSNAVLTLDNYYDTNVTVTVRAQDGTIAHYWLMVQAPWNG
jgi:uncharacterized repeat protein (TIGR02543 family)